MAAEEPNFFDKNKQDMEDIQKQAPELVKSFGNLFYQVMKEGVFSSKTKELIALSIAVAKQCEPCIRLHVKKSIEAGCNEKEIIEAASVAVVMNGGPAYTHLPLVIDTLKILAQEK